MKGDLSAEMEKNGKKFIRKLNPDRQYIDVKGSKNWTLFFRVFGMNSITIYMVTRIVDFGDISHFFLNWFSIHISESWGAVITAIGVLILEWALLYFLYKKKIFLRV